MKEAYSKVLVNQRKDRGQMRGMPAPQSPGTVLPGQGQPANCIPGHEMWVGYDSHHYQGWSSKCPMLSVNKKPWHSTQHHTQNDHRSAHTYLPAKGHQGRMYAFLLRQMSNLCGKEELEVTGENPLGSGPSRRGSHLGKRLRIKHLTPSSTCLHDKSDM